MDVSENRGTPKSSILIGFAMINHPFWGTPIFGNTHITSHQTYRPIQSVDASMDQLLAVADAAPWQMVGWWVGWWVGWLVGWLAGWLAGWLVGWLVVTFVGMGQQKRSGL